MTLDQIEAEVAAGTYSTVWVPAGDPPPGDTPFPAIGVDDLHTLVKIVRAIRPAYLEAISRNHVFINSLTVDRIGSLMEKLQ